MNNQGFSLVEVVIAVAILALCLTSLFSSEAGAIKFAQRSQKTTVATLLARCKMAEIEENLMKEGFPAVSDEGHDECCEDGEAAGFGCEWIVRRVTLPEAGSLDGEGEESGEDSAIGGLVDQVSKDGKIDAENLDPASVLSQGDDALTGMALEFVYPMFKPVIEEQVRRIDVTVQWREGERPVELKVVQFVVSGRTISNVVEEESEESDGTDASGGSIGDSSGGTGSAQPGSGGGSGQSAGGANP